MVRQTSAAFLALSIATVACHNEVAIPQAALEAALTNQTAAQAQNNTPGLGKCPTYGSAGSWLQVGEFRGPTKDATTIIIDGENNAAGNPVSISCSVIPNGDKFDVDATALIDAQTGGSVHIQGSFGTTGEQTGITANFQRADYGSFAAKNCSVSYFAEGEDTTGTSFRGVAAGRVWGFLTCDDAENPQGPTACAATAQFRFENCGKQ